MALAACRIAVKGLIGCLIVIHHCAAAVLHGHGVDGIVQDHLRVRSMCVTASEENNRREEAIDEVTLQAKGVQQPLLKVLI